MCLQALREFISLSLSLANTVTRKLLLAECTQRKQRIWATALCKNNVDGHVSVRIQQRANLTRGAICCTNEPAVDIQRPV